MANQAAQGGGMGQQSAREVSVLLSANTGPYQKEIHKAAEATESLADALVRVEKAYAGTLKFIGSGMMGLGASMQATATGAVWSAAQFEESFARVAKTTGLQNELPFGDAGSHMANLSASFGIGDNALQQFENDIRALSTEIPVSVQELSYLADVAGTLGVESENLVLFSETAAQLGAGINELGSDQAIAGLANLIGAFGDAETSVVNLGSSLAELANHTRGNASDMLQFSDRLAGTAVQVGMTSEEVLGLGAAISAIGVMPELGASAMTQVLTQMSRAVQQGGDDLRKLGAAMGMTADEFQAMWEDQGPTRVIQEFVRSLSQQGEAATLTLQRLGMSGVNITQVFGGLAAQSHVLDDALNISDSAYEAGEAVEELAQIRFDTVIQSMKQFRQATAEVFRSLGQAFLVPLQMIFNTMTNIVNLFNKLPQPLKTAMGLFLGVGGAVITAAGAFTLLVGAFHGFFLLLHSIPILLAGFNKLLVMISGPAGAGAATASINGLTAAVARFHAILTNIPGTIGAAFASAGTMLAALGQHIKTMVVAGLVNAKAGVASLAVVLRTQLAAGATVATAALGRLAGIMRTIVAFAVAETFAVMGTALRAFGTAASFTLARLAPLLAVLGPFAGKLLLLVGAIAAITQGYRWWNERNEETIRSLGELAEATEMATRGIERVSHAYDLSDGSQFDFIAGTRELVSELKDLDQEAAKTKLINYGMMLLAGGNDPEEVQQQIEELARLTGIELVFQYRFEDVTHGPGFDQRQREAGAGVSNFFEDPEMDAFLGTNRRKQFEEGLDEELEAVLDVAQDNRATAIASLIRIRQDLDEALHEGVIDLRIYEQSLRQIDATNLLPEVDVRPDGIAGWFHDNIRPASDFLSRELWTMWEDLGGTIPEGLPPWLDPKNMFTDIDSTDFKRRLGMIAEDEDYLSTPEGEQFREAIVSVVGDVDDLESALQNLDSSGVRDIQEAFYDLGLETANAAHAAANAVESYDTNIERILGQARLELNEEDFGRFEANLFETYPDQVGFQQALEEADQVLSRMMAKGEGWSEDAEKYRRAIKSWGEEWAQIQIRDLEAEINALPAIEQVQRLRQELAALDMSKAMNQPIGAALQNNLNQAIERSHSEFRQLMDQYDRLLEQREQTTQNHNERMERMEEDHNRRMTRMAEDHDRSLQDQHESHAKRMEAIADAEEDALDNRVEQQARAFNIMQRIQSTPTADMGSLIDNMRRQNEAMAEMTAGVEQLRGLGLDEEIMIELGFDDPKNFGQVRRMLAMAVSDPSLIDEMNSLWADRMDLSGAFVEQADTSKITEQFDKQREDAQESLDESIDRIQERYERQVQDANDNYARQVDDANQNYQRQMQDISDNLAKLGVDNAETIDELIQRAMDSGLDGIIARAELMKGVMADVAQSMGDSFSDMMSMADREFLKSAQIYSEASEEMKALIERDRPGGSEAYDARDRPDRPGGDQAFLTKGEIQEYQSKAPGARTTIKLALGGEVPGSGNQDTVPAMLTPGEFVQPVDVVNHYGIEFMEALRDKKVQPFALGGPVGPSRGKGREPHRTDGGQADLVNALTKALTNASLGNSETNNWDVKVEAQDTRQMIKELEAKRRLARLTGGDRDR